MTRSNVFGDSLHFLIHVPVYLVEAKTSRLYTVSDIYHCLNQIKYQIMKVGGMGGGGVGVLSATSTAH